MSDFKELSRSVKGLTVLVTGAASGMGRATALVFAAEGANVAVTDLNAEPTQAVASEIASRGDSAKAWTLDVANPGDIIKVVDDVAAHFGSLDIVINNAGIASMNHTLLTPADTVDRIMATNFRGTFVVCRESAKLMKRRRYGRIVNMATVAVPMRLEGEAIYASS